MKDDTGRKVAGLSREPDDTRVTNLLRDVAFNRQSMNDGHHVSPYDNGMMQVGTDGIVVKLTQGINEDAFKRTLSQATRATIGLDLNVPQAGDWEPCEDGANFAHPTRFTGAGGMEHQHADGAWRPLVWDCKHTVHKHDGRGNVTGQVGYGADWEEMLKGGLQTALESQVIVFQVQGVSRTCTHQIVRTRNAAYHQQSQRASYYGDQPEARMPESVFLNPRARDALIAAKKWSDRAYRIACEEDISYQDARFALLEATTNYIMCEYSLREFINVYAYRGCSMFSWEIVYVMREMRRLLVEAHPWLDPYIKISCEKTSPDPDKRKCTFQGWEEVEGQCDFPWAKEDNRTFVSTAHGIKKRPGMKAKEEVPHYDVKHTPGMRHSEFVKRPLLGERLVATAKGDGVVEFSELSKAVLSEIANAPVLDEHPCSRSALCHRHSPHEWDDVAGTIFYCGGFPESEENPS